MRRTPKANLEDLGIGGCLNDFFKNEQFSSDDVIIQKLYFVMSCCNHL